MVSITSTLIRGLQGICTKSGAQSQCIILRQCIIWLHQQNMAILARNYYVGFRSIACKLGKKKKNLRASNIQGPKALKQEREGEQPAKLYCLYSHKGHQFPTKIILQLNQNN